MRRWVREVATGKVARTYAYLVTSLPAERIGAAALAGLVRRHWRIEARHHVRDVSFGEDASRTRTGHAPQNTAMPKATDSVSRWWSRVCSAPVASGAS
ncbi:hypothetical protein GCM10023224_18900 [Streptomonospora halophila]|uniref:Transposase IS4-like domain-containing protein n=1 Tax=Streptomonospora halophila TaxID=427369 RepID=A0ABP9GDD7_9ACTN